MLQVPGFWINAREQKIKRYTKKQLRAVKKDKRKRLKGRRTARGK